MQELEKIIEKMKEIKDGNRKEKLYAKYPPNSKDQEVLNAYSQGYEDGTDNFYNATAGIIRKHINDGWIPVEERLPEAPEMEDEYPEFNVMIEGDKRTEHEKKIDIKNHYDCLETDVREEARKNFKRQPYKTVSVAQYIAQKYRIGGDDNGQEDS